MNADILNIFPTFAAVNRFSGGAGVVLGIGIFGLVFGEVDKNRLISSMLHFYAVFSDIAG